MLVEGTSNWTCNVSEQTRLAMTATPDSLDAALLEEVAFVITPMSAETAERNFGMDSVAPNERYRLVRSISNGDDDDVEDEDVDDVGNADIIEVDSRSRFKKARSFFVESVTTPFTDLNERPVLEWFSRKG